MSAESRHLRVLNAALRSFADAADQPAAVADAVAREVSRALGVYCGVAVVSEDGQWLQPLGDWDEDPAARELVRTRIRRAPLPMGAPHPVVEALRSGRSLLVSQVDVLGFTAQIPEPQRPSLAGIAVRSLLHVPLRARGQTLGLLTVMRHGAAAELDDGERRLIETFAEQLAVVIHTAQLIQMERTARARAERDLNERRALEQALRKTEEMLNAAPDAMVVVGLDGRIAFVNGQTERLFGYRRDELLGQGIELLVPERFRGAHPAKRTGYFRDAHSRPMATGRELFARRKDGTEFPAEISLAPIETPEGRQVTAAIRDVSQRRRAQEKFKGLLEGAPDAMVIFDARARILLVNAQTEKQFGWSRAELSGRSVGVLLPERFRGSLGSLDAIPEPYGVRKDGTEFPVEISSSLLETEDGVLVSSAIRDVTERRRQRQAIVEANRAKSEFLAHMSHELRTPLNAIIGFTELMHRGRAGAVSDEQREYLGDILSSGRHLLQLINDVLDLAKVEAGKLELRPQTVDLGQLVGEVRDVLRGLAAEKRLKLEVFTAPGLDAVTGDPQRLKQVLYNYLSNAIRFTPEGGRVGVKVAPEGATEFRMDVEDTGIGIGEADLKRLFVEFQQLGGAAERKSSGTGLGLAVTRRIVERMGGRVEVKSALGRGSTFSAVLPRVLAEAAHGG